MVAIYKDWCAEIHYFGRGLFGGTLIFKQFSIQNMKTVADTTGVGPGLHKQPGKNNHGSQRDTPVSEKFTVLTYTCILYWLCLAIVHKDR